jgi:hypothetical protein
VTEIKRALFRITIKELVLEIEGDELAQRAQRSLISLLSSTPPEFDFSQPTYVEDQIDQSAGPKKRGRKPKAAAEAVPAGKRGRKRRPRSDAATARIRQLGAEGFFSEPRRASDVKQALQQAGFEMENRQIYATLKYMADKNLLQRTQEGVDGNWVYSMVGGV